LKISRRKFLSIGGLSALAFSLPSALIRPRGSKWVAHCSLKPEFNPTWLQGNPHLGCSHPYFHHREPTMENRWLEMVHFHMEPELRDATIYGMPHKR
jgi:hypothetical protein